MKRAAVPSILVAVVLLAVAVTAEAQQPKKVPRIGYLSATDLLQTYRYKIAIDYGSAYHFRFGEHLADDPYGRSSTVVRTSRSTLPRARSFALVNTGISSATRRLRLNG